MSIFLLLPRLPIDEDSSTEEAGICFTHEIFDIVPLESDERKGEGINYCFGVFCIKEMMTLL